MYRKEFKSLLVEWKQNFIIENQNIPLKKIKLEISNSRNLSKSDQNKVFSRLENKWNKIYSKFSNVIHSDLTSNDEPIEHILDAIEKFSVFYTNVDSEIKRKISAGDITSSELRGFYESKLEEKKSSTRTKFREKCRNRANLKSNMIWSENSKNKTNDFEVIYVGNDWTVVYPKTILGSISWAVGLHDGAEENYEVDDKGTQIGRVNWCTASYEGNRFPMYAGNLHMYYFIKNKGYRIDDAYRRICISLIKNDPESYEVSSGEKDIVEIKFEGGSTVNANNSHEGLSSYEEVCQTINNQKIINAIKGHALTKKETSIEEMAKKATINIVKQDEKILESEESTKNSQMCIYLKHSDDKEIINYIIKNYKEAEIELDITDDYSPLPFIVFEREDIIELNNKLSLIDYFLKTYKDDAFYLCEFWTCIIYSNVDYNNNFLEDPSLKKQLIEFSIDIIKNKEITSSPFSEYMFHNEILFEDIEQILNAIDEFGHESESANSFLFSLLENFDLRKYSSNPGYENVIKIIRNIISKSTSFRLIIPQLKDKHSYIFESSLKKYIKMIIK